VAEGFGMKKTYDSEVLKVSGFWGEPDNKTLGDELENAVNG
jgi:hypothetical protein